MTTLQTQQGLFREDQTITQRFETWKRTPGGAQILRRVYEVTAGYYEDFKRYGIKTNQRLIWEQVRHRLDKVRARVGRAGHRLEAERGYTMNDHFTKYALLHCCANHPEWAAMFEFRAPKERAVERVTVVRERVVLN